MKLRKTKQINPSQLNADAKRTAQYCVELISDALTKITGEKVVVSLKYFPDNITRSSKEKTLPEDNFVKILAISANAHPNRADLNVLEKVGDSTPLLALMEERKNHYYAQDLIKRDNYLREIGQGKYKDPLADWEDYYQAVIVVPIRMQETLLDPNVQEGMDILGFLWAESKSTSAFRKKDIPAYCDFLKGFADILYQYLDRVDYYENELLHQG
ncbi:MAG: hypothetical protein ACOYY3_18335 [Chloroflexota bacterium]